jgi:hypothetical protein
MLRRLELRVARRSSAASQRRFYSSVWLFAMDDCLSSNGSNLRRSGARILPASRASGVDGHGTAGFESMMGIPGILDRAKQQSNNQRESTLQLEPQCVSSSPSVSRVSGEPTMNYGQGNGSALHVGVVGENQIVTDGTITCSRWHRGSVGCSGVGLGGMNRPIAVVEC